MQLYGTRRLTTRGQARDLLAYAASQTWNFPSLPQLAAMPGGKPHFPQHPDCHFNLSHSGSLALCGVDSAPVGVDIQIVKTTWRDSLPRRTCSPAQLDWLAQQPNHWQAFTQLWVMKESRVKHSGAGLTMSIPSISIPLPQQGVTLYQLDDLWFRLYSGADWAACMCAATPPPEEILWLDGHVAL